jgi:hypothetical protein
MWQVSKLLTAEGAKKSRKGRKEKLRLGFAIFAALLFALCG